MEFVLTGFRHESNIREFTFGLLPSDKDSRVWTVSVDLSLVRKHKIPLQELPLLCRRLLESHEDGPKDSALVFSERDMLGYVNHRSALEIVAEQKKRARKMPSSSRVGMAWRTAPHGSRAVTEH